MRKSQIDELVASIKRQYYFLSLEELIEALGIHLRVVPPDSQVLDGGLACYFAVDGARYIYLSWSCPSERQTFVLAHELGHALMHDVELARYGILFKGRQIEMEANYFAEQLVRERGIKEE